MDKAEEFRNRWSVSLTKSPNGYYTTIVRNSSGDVHDKMVCDTRRAALEYYRAFRAIAHNA